MKCWSEKFKLKISENSTVITTVDDSKHFSASFSSFKHFSLLWWISTDYRSNSMSWNFHFSENKREITAKCGRENFVRQHEKLFACGKEREKKYKKRMKIYDAKFVLIKGRRLILFPWRFCCCFTSFLSFSLFSFFWQNEEKIIFIAMKICEQNERREMAREGKWHLIIVALLAFNHFVSRAR